jgi:hypothetical protein
VPGPARRGLRYRLTRGRGDASVADKGYVLVITALLLLPLVAFTGFAIDLGAWTARASKAQSAADAASLAGVVYLPDLPTKAVTVARETASRNGYTDGVGGVTVTVTPNARNELQVSIFDPQVEQYFSSLFVSSPTISRNATAEFIRPVAMGSPEAFMGQDPERGFNPQFVINTAGWSTNKQNGDKRSAGQCGGSFAGCTPPNSAAGVNTDYAPNGYLYTVNVGATAAVGAQPLRFEIYDPAYTYNDDGCGTNGLSNAQANTINANFPGDPFALQRYQGNRTLPSGLPNTWCMGDQRLSAQGTANGSSIVTTYIVRAPDDTPSDLNDNPAVCAISFDPYGDFANGSQPGAVFDLLNSNTIRGREQLRFRDHYRKWFPVCEIPAGAVQRGDYVLQIRTNADLSSPQRNITGGLTSGAGSLENAASPFPSTGGHNRYTMRTGFGTGAVGGQSSLSTVPASPSTFGGVTLSAVGNLPIYMNQIPPGGATAEFFLARITPETAGKTLQLTFWDMADIASGSATFSLLQGADAGGTPFSCSFSRDGQVPAPGVTITGCQMAGITTANYNGRNVVVRIPIPGNYTCNVADPLGCWVKVRVAVVGAGATPSDTTTWSATMTGDPIRLIR